MEVIQIDQNTWRFEDDMVRFFLLEGEDRAALIDSGMNCPDAGEAAERLTGKPLILINTHGDIDHISGTAWFNEIHMHMEDYVSCEIEKQFPDTALARVNDEDVIDLGNRPLRIIHIPGHTKGSIAILDVKKRVLYAGDSVQKGHIYMFGEKRVPEMLESSLDILISMKDEYDFIYASHDEFMLPNDYAEKVKAVWKAVRNGEIPFEQIDLFGNSVRSYTAADCGFFGSNG